MMANDGTQGNGDSLDASVSADGRYVSFASQASNLVPGDTNGRVDVFVFDRQAHSIERVSVDSVGNQGDDISAICLLSADGRAVVQLASGSITVVPTRGCGCGSPLRSYDPWSGARIVKVG